MMHDIDFVIRLMGEPEKITADKLNIREQQSIVNACFQYPDSYARIRGASSMPLDMRLLLNMPLSDILRMDIRMERLKQNWNCIATNTWKKFLYIRQIAMKQ